MWIASDIRLVHRLQGSTDALEMQERGKVPHMSPLTAVGCSVYVALTVTEVAKLLAKPLLTVQFTQAIPQCCGAEAEDRRWQWIPTRA